MFSLSLCVCIHILGDIALIHILLLQIVHVVFYHFEIFFYVDAENTSEMQWRDREREREDDWSIECFI